MIGVAAGLVFRWKVLLPAVIVLPFPVIGFAISHGFGYEQTAITVIFAEAIVQGGYFAGLLLRFLAAAATR